MRPFLKLTSLLSIPAIVVALPTVPAAQTPSNGTIARVLNPPLKADLDALPGDLRAMAVPGPTNLNEFIRDDAAALALGKAFFWDMQVGSDGVQACASCHFRAGADPRSKNQLSPGLKHVPKPDFSYSRERGPNHQLIESDFPLTRLDTPGVRGLLNPAVDSDDVVASQGIHHPADAGADPNGFAVDGLNVRRVEPRNTPTVINAVFNHRQFWDGRAENIFNGVNHLGDRDLGARLVRADDAKNPAEVRVSLANSSLASQAVAPIISDLEMAAPGRSRLDVAHALAKAAREQGRRINRIRPLALQQVSPTDSVLGILSRSPQAGIAVSSYDRLIRQAFHEKWYRAKKIIRVNDDGTLTFVDRNGGECPVGACAPNEFSLIEFNFTLFFGLAVQVYEATLVADDTPWDRFRRDHPNSTDPALNPWINENPQHISRLALFGAMLFNDRTRGATNVRCSNCHEQAELTDASARRIGSPPPLGPMRNRDGNIIDRGFNNIGIRPTADDLGVGATDAFGPLSFTRRLFPGAPPPTFDNGAAVTKGFGVDGAFKIPSLRNVALTAPYFHNGDVMTLHDAVDLYSRGGNSFPVHAIDGTLIEPLGVPLLSSAEIDAIVAFLEALTDERVLYRRAPFDHPQLFVPNGHPGDSKSTTDADRNGLADDLFVEIPAVGAEGGAPLPGFLKGMFGPQP